MINKSFNYYKLLYVLLTRICDVHLKLNKPCGFFFITIIDANEFNFNRYRACLYKIILHLFDSTYAYM